ncbi:hypothetical protein CSIM01_13308 [Colletotrichum simmondsii]|uniref:Uncharacterized protein n=1 Tax=Colletotrichum simmondsii TaxID=703756 RepID=A0A135RT15_9PEZI|nr:hypothetical protein CSIM01_13308 [Colletotrichum simmondsii]
MGSRAQTCGRGREVRAQGWFSKTQSQTLPIGDVRVSVVAWWTPIRGPAATTAATPHPRTRRPLFLSLPLPLALFLASCKGCDQAGAAATAAAAAAAAAAAVISCSKTWCWRNFVVGTYPTTMNHHHLQFLGPAPCKLHGNLLPLRCSGGGQPDRYLVPSTTSNRNTLVHFERGSSCGLPWGHRPWLVSSADFGGMGGKELRGVRAVRLAYPYG